MDPQPSIPFEIPQLALSPFVLPESVSAPEAAARVVERLRLTADVTFSAGKSLISSIARGPFLISPKDLHPHDLLRSQTCEHVIKFRDLMTASFPQRDQFGFVIVPDAVWQRSPVLQPECTYPIEDIAKEDGDGTGEDIILLSNGHRVAALKSVPPDCLQPLQNVFGPELRYPCMVLPHSTSFEGYNFLLSADFL